MDGRTGTENFLPSHQSLTIMEDGLLNIGSDANLSVYGSLTLAAGVTGDVEGGLTIEAGGSIGGKEIITGSLTLSDGAYFDEGSLKLVVIPEPHTLGLLLAASVLLALRRRKREL